MNGGLRLLLGLFEQLVRLAMPTDRRHAPGGPEVLHDLQRVAADRPRGPEYGDVLPQAGSDYTGDGNKDEG